MTRAASPTAPGRHRATRPRYGRLTALAASISVVAVALVGSAGGWDDRSDDTRAAVAEAAAGASSAAPTAGSSGQGAGKAGKAGKAGEVGEVGVPPAEATPTAPASSAPAPSAPAARVTPAANPKAVPADSGEGRRVIFDQSAQRVWLVDADEHTERTYLTSGSVLDNLHPGTYHVYSRSRWAVGVDDSGVMEYFVRFTRGPSGAAIGFHTIPTKDGVPLQTEAQLGTPQSHGCIRQRTEDAIALWEFAPEGTTVVVIA